MPHSRPPLWYKDAIIYEVHVRAFSDSNGDGIGDFPGLTSRLDYLSRLGVTAIWLLPFYPSPLRDDGYDIADYYDVHPSYGTLEDFQHFLAEAHSRNMQVITELVINHTSDQHPWFQRARRAAPGTPERDFYVWSDDPDAMSDVRIIFQDTESSNWAWDSAADAYYWHRFFSHQPDLNYDNPEVRDAVTDVLRFWLDMGVDGVRLDAIPYLHEREGTNGENLPETHDELKRLRAFVDEHYEDRMLLAEANQWPEDSVAYFGDGDECHMAFHFPLMPRLYLALQTESRLPITDILEQTPPIPENAQWAIFLRNHDELTLEMVTEEERDLMWRTYAPDRRARINLGIRRRLAPLMQGDRRRIELLYGLLLSLPGTPVLYYGDEIGMGDNIFLNDRDGVRTPMQWSNDRNAGFSPANPQSLYMPVVVDPQFHYETVNVNAQQANPNSLLSWVRRHIEQRKRHPLFGRGSIEFLDPDNDRVLAYLRGGDDGAILVVANLSSDAQYVELDLSRFAGLRPTEMLGGTEFPTVGELPYLLTLGPYAFSWFTVGGPADRGEGADQPIQMDAGTDELFAHGEVLPNLIADRIARQPWYQRRHRSRTGAAVAELLPLNPGHSDRYLWLALVDVHHSGHSPDRYVVPLGLTFEDDVPAESVVARVVRRDQLGVVFDAVQDADFQSVLMARTLESHTVLGRAGSMHCTAGALAGSAENPPAATAVSIGTGEVAIQYGPDVAIKLFPRVEAGPNPDLELRRFLTERTPFGDTADVHGALEYRSGDTYTIGVLQQWFGDAPNAWSVFSDLCRSWLESIRVGEAPPEPPASIWDRRPAALRLPAPKALDRAVRRVDQLAEMTAQLHQSLGSMSEQPDIEPLPFSVLYQQGLYQSLRSTVRSQLASIRRLLPTGDERLDDAIRQVVEAEREFLPRLEPVRRTAMAGRRTRLHGDYRLDEVRLVDDRFVLPDLSGDHRLAMSQRRLRASPLRDVADMLRSLDYVATDLARRADEKARGWAPWWSHIIGARFVNTYLTRMEHSLLLPADPEAVAALLDAYTLARSLRELHWELQVRPDWIAVPLAALRRALGHAPALLT